MQEWKATVVTAAHLLLGLLQLLTFLQSLSAAEPLPLPVSIKP